MTTKDDEPKQEIDVHGNVEKFTTIGTVCGNVLIGNEKSAQELLRRPQSEIINFTSLIRDSTKDFVGRQFIFDALDEFLRNNRAGYFIIEGEPGIGKTAIAAELVKRHGYFHHFLIATQGIVHIDQFVRNVAAQMALKYQIGELYIPATPIDSGKSLMDLLERVSLIKRDPGEKVIVVIDGLDEAEFSYRPGANIFYLPSHLPESVYFILTYRPKHQDLVPLYVSAPQQTIYLDADSEQNLIDIAQYLSRQVKRPRLQKRLASKGVPEKDFINLMIRHSEGNFMYLSYILPEIERGEYPDLLIENLPKGLVGYYEHHWRKMRDTDEETYALYLEPIILCLAVAREPLSLAMLSRLTGISELHVRMALRRWAEFLMRDQSEGRITFRIYHNSFKEFLRRKNDIEGLGMEEIESKIATIMRDEWQKIKGKYTNQMI